MKKLAPMFHQVRFARNDSWLHSLYLGWIWPIFSLPEILLCNLLLPLMSLSWDWPVRLFWRVYSTGVLLVKLPVYGTLGWVSWEDVTLQEMQQRLMFVQLQALLRGE